MSTGKHRDTAWNETCERVKSLATLCNFAPGGTFYYFDVLPDRDGAIVQGAYFEECVDTGKRMEQKTRRWLISPHATDSEIVQTLFKLCLTSMEHRAREHFRYRGRPIFGPHFDVDALHSVCDMTDERKSDER